MSTIKLIFSIIQLIVSVSLISIVILQSGKRSGLSGAIAGAADSFLSKNDAKSWDARLAKATTWVAIAFIVLTLIVTLL